jgi:hypothetical protein
MTSPGISVPILLAGAGGILETPRRPKSDEEKRRVAERRVVRERERETSRLYH